MYGRKQTAARFLGLGLLLGSAACADGGGTDPVEAKPGAPELPVRGTLAALAQATDCTDLLARIQNDAIAKLRLSVELAKLRAVMERKNPGASSGFDEDVAAVDEAPAPRRDAARPSTVNASAPLPASSGVGQTSGASRNPVAPPGSSSAASDGDTASSDEESAPQSPTAPGTGPLGASETNKQVQDVDEADIVKVVQSGRGIFLLHGNTVRKLSSWPAAETKLAGMPLTVEGQPTEMFASDDGKVIVFSSVAYGSGESRGGGRAVTDVAECPPGGGCRSYGGGGLKVTVASMMGDAPVVERELYYEGSYVSSRRYAGQGSDVVRAIVQANTKFSGLFEPDIEWYDPWGRVYDDENIASQLAEWEGRTTAAIRNTTLDDWLPTASEKRAGKLEKLPPTCGSYFVPTAGLADYGLTHVLAIDVAQPQQPAGGVTILGATSTVYSSAKQLVLAQPDYRWSSEVDFGVESQQQTALHVFDLAATTTAYRASGWVPGHLPLRNPQFGIDVKDDGTIRLATTGMVRQQPDAMPDQPRFWQQKTRNQVLTARPEGNALTILGTSVPIGKEGENVYSSRFVGDRAYVVTFRQTDPFYVIDVANPAAPTVLGELQIPGFSEYMHPLDPNHIITVGQSGTRGLQLQLYDVTDPNNLPLPKVLDFGSGSSSEVSYQHKAFTFFEGVLAIPVSGVNYSSRRYGAYGSALQLVRVDANAGFTHLGAVDHTRLYADNGAGVTCGVCDANGCMEYFCGYAPEVRRGVFVKGDAATYVYSISHAGVLVNDLANLTTPIASVGLPAPQGGEFDGTKPRPPSRPRPAIDASVVPSAALDGGVAMPVPTPDSPPAAGQDAGAPAMPTMTPEISDGGTATPTPSDAGAPTTVAP